MDSTRRTDLLKQRQAVMYAEPPMIGIDCPSALQAVDTLRCEGRQPYLGASVWDDMIDCESYVMFHAKIADAATGSSGGSATMWMTLGVVAAVVVAERRGRAVEE